MSDLRDDRKKAGYDLEEAYFHKQNRELIEKMKSRGLTVIEGGKGGDLARKAQSPRSEDQYKDRKKAA